MVSPGFADQRPKTVKFHRLVLVYQGGSTSPGPQASRLGRTWLVKACTMNPYESHSTMEFLPSFPGVSHESIGQPQNSADRLAQALRAPSILTDAFLLTIDPPDSWRNSTRPQPLERATGVARPAQPGGTFLDPTLVLRWTSSQPLEQWSNPKCHPLSCYLG